MVAPAPAGPGFDRKRLEEFLKKFPQVTFHVSVVCAAADAELGDVEAVALEATGAAVYIIPPEEEAEAEAPAPAAPTLAELLPEAKLNEEELGDLWDSI